MARLILLIAVIAIALILWHKIKKASGKERKKLIFWSVGAGVIAILGALAVTGHLNVITAAIAGGIALLPKLLQFARYLPLINRLYQQRGQQPGQQNAQQQNGQRSQSPRGKKSMSAEEAMEVLALKPGYTKEDVIQAHRRMMQKVHPDRGGSDYLAAQINAARDTLLS
ncbi:MAG: molecular chaperone DnaJ [Gammaproteobacteria bacterium]